MPISFLQPSPGRHGRTAVGCEQHHAAVKGTEARVVHAGAKVVGGLHPNDSDAVFFCPAHGFCARPFGQHLADAIAAVDNCHGTRINHKFRISDRGHDSISNSIKIPAQPQDPVGLVSPQIGLNQGVGYQACISIRHAGINIDSSGKLGQVVWINVTRCGHTLSIRNG